MRISYRHIKRYREIAQVMIKYGFSFIIERINKDNGSKVDIDSTEPVDDIKKMTSGERLRYALQELGPTYVKMGQILSTRRDLLDKDMIEELEKLRDDVSFFETETAMKIIEDEIKMPVDEIFESISSEPIAAASIGQVYEATLKTGESVIVKVQRPGIENTIKSDLEILKRVSDSAQDVVADYNINLKDVIEELSTQLLRELDYNYEAINAVKMKKMFQYSEHVYIPEIYMEYTTKRVLVMEKINGVKVSDIETIKEKGWDPVKIADIGVKSFIMQVLTHGFFHADPHPGNIFVIDKEKIAYIDFGMIGIIDKKTLKHLNQFAIACINKDVDRIAYVLYEMDSIDENTDMESFRQEIMYMIHYYYDVPIEKISFGSIIGEVFSFFRKYRVKMPSQLVTLAKTIITLEGTGRMLNPGFSVKGISREFAKNYYKESLNPKNIAKEKKQEAEEMFHDFKSMPKQIKGVLRVLEKNNLKITIEDVKMRRIEDCLKEMTTQMSMSLVLAALIVGSSLIIASPNLESSRTIKIMSFFGFFTSFIVGILLVIDIIRTRISKK